MKYKFGIGISALLIILMSSFGHTGLASADASVGFYSTTNNRRVTSVTNGPDGNVWFTEVGNICCNDYVGKVTPSGAVTEYPLGADYNPSSIAAGTDGNLWFAESTPTNRIGRIDPSGNITTFSIPIVNGNNIPHSIASDYNGNLWFTESDNGLIGKVATDGTFTMYSTGSYYPGAITYGSDGNMWFTDNTTDAVGKIDRNTGALTEYSVSSVGSNLIGITRGSDGGLWFTATAGNKIGRISTSGSVRGYSIPTANASPAGITTGADGYLWFAESATTKIASLTTSGVFTEYAVPANTNLSSIAFGSDNALWFSTSTTTSNQIGRLAPPIPDTPTNLTVLSSTNSYPRFGWNPKAGVVSYNVYRNGSFLASTPGAFTDTTATAGVYSYTVTSVNGGGESAQSTPISIAYDPYLLSITKFTGNDGTNTYRATVPVTGSITSQTINANGSLSLNINGATGYADSGFYRDESTMSYLPSSFTVKNTGAPITVNLWIDNMNLGDFFQWNSAGVMTGTGGDVTGYGPSSATGTLSVSSSTSFTLPGGTYTLAQLKSGADTADGITSSTKVAVWIGTVVGSGGSASSTVTSFSGL